MTGVTFTRRAFAAYDPATDVTGAPTTTTITGSAVQVRGDPQRYRALELIESEAPTLLFAPTTYGQVPKAGDTIPWPPTGPTYTVRDVQPIAPDGVVILARVVVSR